MNKDLLALRPGLFRKGAVDGALRERKGRAVGIGVMNHVVEGASGRFCESKAREFLRRPVHEYTVLSFIHEEDGHGRVAQYDIKSGGCFSQRGLNTSIIRRILDGGIEDRVIAVVKELKLDGHIVCAAVLALVEGVEVKSVDLARLEGFDQSQEIGTTDVRLQIPGCQP